MKLAEATNLDRKSGERGAPIQNLNARVRIDCSGPSSPCYRNLDRNIQLS